MALAAAFTLLRLAPGDPAELRLLAGGGAPSSDALAALRAAHGLDRPLGVQFLAWLGEVARGGLGRSLATDRPVLAEVAARLPWSLAIGTGGLALALGLGASLGYAAALRPGGLADRGSRALAVLAQAVLRGHGGGVAALALIAALVPELGWAIGGTAVVELVFSVPGLSALLVEAAGSRDYTVRGAAPSHGSRADDHGARARLPPLHRRLFTSVLVAPGPARSKGDEHRSKETLSSEGGSIARRFPPERIVCLTEETVETLYLLGEDRRVVGVSGYAVRPPRVRREKPRASAFTSAVIPKVLALEPDLVLAFSDLQADIVADLIRAGVAVHAFNQRDVAGILAMIRALGSLVGAGERAEALAAGYEARLARFAAEVGGLPRPRVYFEEWDEPMISGIGWVSELVGIAGGDDVFPTLARQGAARDRIVAADAVIAAAPDVILASWCGKRVVASRITGRPGWDVIPAVRTGRVVEIKSPLILQPGPAALTDGLDAIREALREATTP